LHLIDHDKLAELGFKPRPRIGQQSAIGFVLEVKVDGLAATAFNQGASQGSLANLPGTQQNNAWHMLKALFDVLFYPAGYHCGRVRGSMSLVKRIGSDSYKMRGA
jgi:hypothetical protein